MPNKSFVQGDDQNEGSHGDNQEFGHDTQIPGQDKPGNPEDDREMEYVEGQQRLIAIGDYLAFEVQIFGGHTKYKYNPAPPADDVSNVEKNVFERKRLSTTGIAGRYQESKTSKAEYPQGQTNPPMSLNTIGIAWIYGEDITDHKENSVGEQIRPGIRSHKHEVFKSDADPNQGNQKQEDATRADADTSQFVNNSSTRFWS